MVVRDLQTEGQGPAVLSEHERSVFTLVDCAASQGREPMRSPDLETTFYGNIQTTGYTALLQMVDERRRAHFTFSVNLDLDAYPIFGLEVEETPQIRSNEGFADWSNVMDFGADPTDEIDDAAAIQGCHRFRTIDYLLPDTNRWGARDLSCGFHLGGAQKRGSHGFHVCDGETH
ncbi:MAG: hypothetical protein R3C68_01740 [Myxococcota bacterium]